MPGWWEEVNKVVWPEMKSEIVITSGLPAAGKTSAIASYLEEGYTRLNRDSLGGTLEGIAQKLEQFIKAAPESYRGRYILDNTYPTKVSRARVIEVGKKYNVPVKCLRLQTSIEDAQFNAATRMVRKYGRLLDNDEIKAQNKQDPNCFPIGVLFQYRKNFEEPSTEEGFSEVVGIPFVRQNPAGYANKALFLDYDGTLRNTKSGNKYPVSIDDIEINSRCRPVIQKYSDAGYRLLGVSNQSGIAKGILTEATAHSLFKETNRQLDLDIEYSFCPHQSNPIVCYCRKPCAGRAVEFIEKYKLDRSQCIMVGDLTSDRTFASRAGFEFYDAEEFFKNE